MNNIKDILKGHELFLLTRGVEGTRADLHEADLRGADLHEANLRGADLCEANLFLIKDKDIITFQYNKHFAYYCDGYIKIGCKLLTVDEWIASAEAIGKEQQYTKKEIDLYLMWIKMVKGVMR